VFFGFRIKGSNDGDSGIRFHDVTSKHVAGLLLAEGIVHRERRSKLTEKS
jgi:hypothetical protein